MTELAELIATVGIVVMLIAIPVVLLVIFALLVSALIKNRLDGFASDSLVGMALGTFRVASDNNSQNSELPLGIEIEQTQLTDAEKEEWERITETIRDEEY